jgi:hypothetical protein
LIYKNDKKSDLNAKKCALLIGDPISFIERIALGQVSSPTLNLIKYSSIFVSTTADQKLDSIVHITIRPKGIIVIFTASTQEFYWAIPFYKLNLYSSIYLSIHADGHFMQFDTTYLNVNAVPFFKKLHQLKVDSMPPGSDYFDY